MAFRLDSRKSVVTDKDGVCSFLGARTEETAKSRKCNRCQVNTPEVYKKCTKESDRLLSTSTIVGANGVTKNAIIPGRFNTFGSIIDETVVVKEKPVESNKVTKRKVNQKVKAMTEKNGVKAVKSGGAVGLAKKLLNEGKNDGEVLAALIQYYITAGRDAKKAKHNAQSALFNAKKKPAVKDLNSNVAMTKDGSTGVPEALPKLVESPTEGQEVDAGEEEIVD